jgi:hypothetical protein
MWGRIVAASLDLSPVPLTSFLKPVLPPGLRSQGSCTPWTGSQERR